MFGNYRASTAYDVPSGLDFLERATAGRLGASRCIVESRTSVAGQLPFLPAPRREASVDAFVAGASALGSRLLALRARGLPVARLRFCRTCAEQDSVRFGYARWLLSHQLEGTWRCFIHACALTEIVGRPSAWLLPPWRQIIPELPWSKFASALDRAAIVSSTALELGAVDSEGLRRTALARLTESRLVANPSRMSATDLINAFDRSQIGVWARQYDPLKSLLTQPMWIVSLLQGRGASHPLKWSLIWAWLWEDDQLSDVRASFRTASAGVPERDSKQQLHLFSEGEAAHRTHLRTLVVRAMESSATLRGTAHSLGVSEQVVRQLLSQDPATRMRWELRLWEVRKQKAIDSIRTAIRDLHVCDRVSLSKACAVDVHWLQRNDLDAARAELSRIPARRSGQRPLFDN